MKMPGFRQGKVPVDVVKKVHAQALRDEVIQQAVSKLAFARIEQDKLAIAGEPFVEKMDDRGAEGFQADIAVEVLPEVELPELDGLRVEIPAAALQGEAFDEAQQIELVLEANKRSLPVQGRPIGADDLVLLMVQSSEAASKRKWPRQETYFMMKDDNPSEISGLYDALLGKQGGESFALQAAYPADGRKKSVGREKDRAPGGDQGGLRTEKTRAGRGIPQVAGFEERRGIQAQAERGIPAPSGAPSGRDTHGRHLREAAGRKSISRCPAPCRSRRWPGA